MATTLLNTPAQIIRQLLVDMEVATDGGVWPAYHGVEAASPDNAITVYSTQGQPQSRRMIDGKIVEKRGLQIRVRSVTETVGWVRADLIRATLSEDVYRRTVHIGSNSYLVHACDRFGEILYLGLESPTSVRALHTMNFVAAIRQL